MWPAFRFDGDSRRSFVVAARILAVAAFMAIAVSEAFAQAPKIGRIDVLESAIYQMTLEQNRAGESQLSFLSAVELTNTIPAKVGTAFGFRYIVVGEPPGARVPLTLVTIYPLQGMRDPKTGFVASRKSEQVFATLGVPNLSGFKFDDQSEVLTGDWVFELWDRDTKLAEQKFKIVR